MLTWEVAVMFIAMLTLPAGGAGAGEAKTSNRSLDEEEGGAAVRP